MKTIITVGANIFIQIRATGLLPLQNENPVCLCQTPLYERRILLDIFLLNHLFVSSGENTTDN